MKTFDEIYEELQSGDNNELNIAYQQAKKESEKGQKISKTICIILDTVLVIMVLMQGINFKLLSIFLLFFMVIFVVIINAFVSIIINLFLNQHKHQSEYTAQYKKIVINKLMNNFYDNLEFFPNKGIPEYIYKEPKYHFDYDIYRSEDYIEAQINNKHSIQMAEVITKNIKKYKDSDGEEHTRIITLFHGLFAKIVMHKSIMGELKITQNGQLKFDKRLEMDSSEFEKYFDVKASDDIMGMQILTADVMEELIEFKNKTNMEFDIFINGNELYLRFHSDEMFEPGNFKKGALDKETIREYFYMLNFTYNLSNKIINVVDETMI